MDDKRLDLSKVLQKITKTNRLKKFSCARGYSCVMVKKDKGDFMKKIFLSMLFIASSSFGAWKDMGNNISIETSRSNENEVWVKFQYQSPQEIKGVYGKLATHFISKVQANCSNYSLNILQQNFYDINGTVLDSSSYPTGFRETVPDSIGDNILNKVCDFKKVGSINSSDTNIFSKNNSDKTCEQIVKDAYYYKAISSICYHKSNINLDNFSKSYINNNCGELSNSMANAAEIKVSNAIKSKANAKGLDLFCEEEKGYYTKVVKKYNSSKIF